MPVQTTQSKLNFAGALRTHAKDETTYGQDFTNLPGGITNGIAELVEAKRGVYGQGTKKAGKEYILLQGSVASPATVIDRMPIFKAGANGRPGTIEYAPDREVPVKGLFTRQFLDLGPTTKKDRDGKDVTVSAEDNIKIALNELRKLGGDDCTDALASLPPTATDEQAKKVLDAILDALKKSRIRFKFSTRYSKPSSHFPTPMTFENWQGRSTGPSANGHAEAFVDETEQLPEDGAGEDMAAAEGGEVVPEDIDALVASANDDNDPGQGDAQARLHQLCEEAGIDKDWYTADDTTWEEIGAALQAPADEPEPEEPAEPKPAVKEVYGYKAPVKGPKGKPVPGKKAIRCSVKAVDDAKQTVDLLNTIDKKTVYKAVPWAELIRE